MLSQYASENVRRGKTESASERKKHRRTCLQKGEVTKGSEDARHRDGHFQRGHEARGSHACLLAPATSVRTHRRAQQGTRARSAAHSASCRRKTRMMPGSAQPPERCSQKSTPCHSAISLGFLHAAVQAHAVAVQRRRRSLPRDSERRANASACGHAAARNSDHKWHLRIRFPSRGRKKGLRSMLLPCPQPRPPRAGQRCYLTRVTPGESPSQLHTRSQLKTRECRKKTKTKTIKQGGGRGQH